MPSPLQVCLQEVVAANPEVSFRVVACLGGVHAAGVRAKGTALLEEGYGVTNKMCQGQRLHACRNRKDRHGLQA